MKLLILLGFIMVVVGALVAPQHLYEGLSMVAIGSCLSGFGIGAG